MIDYLDAALNYFAKGWNVMPVKENKRPLCKWREWGNKRQELDEIIKLPWNKAKGVAGITGINGYCAIDVDRENIAKAKDFFDGFNETRVHVTPNEGYHLIFKSRVTASSTDRWRDRFGIELQGMGNYILLPPSLDEKYKVKNEEVAILEVENLYEIIKERAVGLGWTQEEAHFKDIDLDNIRLPIKEPTEIPCIKFFKNNSFPEGGRELVIGKNLMLILRKLFGDDTKTIEKFIEEISVNQKNFNKEDIKGWMEWSSNGKRFNCIEVKKFIDHRFQNFSCRGCPIRHYLEYGELDMKKVMAQYCGWLSIEEEDIIRYIFALFLTNFILGDPVWLMIVAPPGAVKTELLRSFPNSRYVYTTSTITEHTLISGKDNVGDLMPLLDNKLFIIKDFTSILSKNNDSKREIYADFREAYDGYIEKTFGSGVGKKGYEAHFSVLTAVTPAIDGYQLQEQLLGERFIKCRLNKHNNAVEKAMENTGREEEMRKILKDVNYCFCRQLIDKYGDNLTSGKTAVVGGKQVKNTVEKAIIKPINLSDRLAKRLICIAKCTAMLRTQIQRDRDKVVKVVPEPEIGTRLVKQYKKLAMGLKLLENSLTDDDLERMIGRIAEDTMPKRRMVILENLFDLCNRNSEYYSTRSVALYSNLPTATVHEELENLQMLGISEKLTDDTSGGKQIDTWKVSDAGIRLLHDLGGEKWKLNRAPMQEVL